MRIPRLVVALVFLMLCSFDALGQAHPAWMERGQAAFAEARYDDAQEAFQWIIDRESGNGEVRYLMAKVLMAKGEVKAADRSIVRALRIEPENTQYLELQLEIGFPREPMEIIRRTRRDDLAAKILTMDSLSVPANIQLGQRFVYEWLEWRGRITVDDMAALPTPGRPNFTGNLGAENANPNRPVAGGRTEIPADLFDLKNQETLGKDIIDLSPRAKAAYPKAVAYLKKALLREPENERAILHLARLYTTWPNLVALSSLGKSLQKNTPDSRYGWLLRGYAQHYLGNERIAEEEFSRALTFMPDSIRTVFSDTDRLLNKEELKQKKRNSDFDDDAFWDYRDPRFLTPENERLAEHYARVFFAELHYSEPKLDLEGWDSERGEVYIRYGKPDVEYYMSNAVAQCGAATYDQFHIFEYANFRFVFGNLWPQLNQYVFYSPCSRVYESFAAMGAQIDYVIDAKDNIDENPEIYKHEATRKRVEFPYLASRFKGENGEVDVYVPYGIPVQANALELEQTLSLHAGAFLLSEEEGL
ncbi:MAG: GWxTD domain-containing protein, partial [Rhodothermales bacterium]